MIKRILVPLDPDSDTSYATQYAADIAQRHGASVTGMAVVNTADMYADTGSGSVESIYFANEVKNLYVERSRQEAGNLLDRFERVTGKMGIPHREVIEEGIPSERVNDELKYYDLLVVGRESHFQYLRPDHQTKTISKILKEAASPVLIVTRPFEEVKRVLVTLDGQAEAARALRWFIHLQPFGTEISMELVHVTGGSSAWGTGEARRMLNASERYLGEHGFNDVHKRILDGGSAGSTLLEYISEQSADLVLMGMHSMSVLRRFTVGSTSYSLVKNSPTALFTVH